MQFIINLWEYIWSNKEWLFSGIGVLFLTGIVTIVVKIIKYRKNNSKTQTLKKDDKILEINFDKYTMIFYENTLPFPPSKQVKKEDNPFLVDIIIPITIINKNEKEIVLYNLNIFIKNKNNEIIFSKCNFKLASIPNIFFEEIKIECMSKTILLCQPIIKIEDLIKIPKENTVFFSYSDMKNNINEIELFNLNRYTVDNVDYPLFD